MAAVFVAAVFASAYVLIATEKVSRIAVVLTGAGLLLLSGVVSADDAFHSTETGIDWNVIFLLLGMMLIVGVMRRSGLFDYAAIVACKRSRGRPFRILVSLIVLTAVASALLDNVTTVLLVAPVTIAVAGQLGLPPVPFLIAEALASNIGGAGTLVGDPPNIIIGSHAGLSYADFLVHLGPLVVVLLAVYVLMARLMFRRALRYDPAKVAALMQLREEEAITDRPLAWRSLAVLGAVTVGFVLHGSLHIDPSVFALVGAGVLVVLSGRDVSSLMREVEWATLVFFAGLFVMVGALVKVGVVDHLADAAASVAEGRPLVAVLSLLGFSAVLSAIVDNIPYVATMAPVVDRLVADMPAGPSTQALWWALAIGADLGGNATAIGASANVVVLGIADRYGQRISFLEFARYGALVAVVTVGLSAPYLWLRYFVFG